MDLPSRKLARFLLPGFRPLSQLGKRSKPFLLGADIFFELAFVCQVLTPHRQIVTNDEPDRGRHDRGRDDQLRRNTSPE